MTKLIEILAVGAVSASLPIANRKALFAHFGHIAELEYGLQAHDVVDRLTERERLGSTGFGNGIAIPHGRIAGLSRVVGMFARLSSPIDFQAIDDLPVDLVFCLLSPPDAGADHLKALALVSRWLRDPVFVAKLRGAASGDAVYVIFDAAYAPEIA